MLKSTFLAVVLTFFCVAGIQAEAVWLTDYAKAKAQAAAEKKPLLLDFTGSDWCTWCIKLDKDVFAIPAFGKYANANDRKIRV